VSLCSSSNSGPSSERCPDASQCLVIGFLTFSKLELVKDGRFTGGIESDHEDAHLLLAEL
jgi:hypothetical protein